jgi:hypothetical protein
MSIIDALIFTIGFDTTKFDQGKRAADASFKDLKDKAKKQGDDIERHATFATEVINKLAAKIIGIATAAAGGVDLARFIENITRTDASIGRLANNFGVSAKKLAAWDLLGRRVARPGRLQAPCSLSMINFRNCASMARRLRQGRLRKLADLADTHSIRLPRGKKTCAFSRRICRPFKRQIQGWRINWAWTLRAAKR